jgi:hypothetical protein
VACPELPWSSRDLASSLPSILHGPKWYLKIPLVSGECCHVSLERGAGSREPRFLVEDLKNPKFVGHDTYYQGRNNSTSIWIQTRHRPLPMTIVHYWLFNWYRELQNERWMKLCLATKFSSTSRKKNSPTQELHTMIWKTWSSGPSSLIAESIMSGTIHKACALMTCPLAWMGAKWST